MIQATRKLNIESAPDLEHRINAHDTSFNVPPPPTVFETKGRYPKISTFYGKNRKVDANYKTWLYEARFHIGKHSEEQIFASIRHSIRGETANILYRLRFEARVRDILRKFESTYGEIETTDSPLRKFYNCQQYKTESVSAFAVRLEEMKAEGLDFGALDCYSGDILRSVFYQGLRPQIKQMANYKYDTIKNYDEFKIEIRKIENELSLAEKDTSCKPANKFVDKDKSELTK